MPDSLDTNILVYLLSQDSRKAAISRRLLAGEVVIGVQVLNELTNVARRKAGLDWSEIARFILHVKSLCDVRPMTVSVHDEGRRLAERYRLSTYDALICAAALDAGAPRLFSEDMQDGLTIDSSLRIVDPYREERDEFDPARG